MKKKVLLLTMALLFTLLLFPFGSYAVAATDLDNACRIAATQTWYWPFSKTSNISFSKITSSYGYRVLTNSKRVHHGVDIGAPKNTPVYPIQTGVVTKIINSNSGSAGRYVVINHNNGFYSWYMHLQEIKVNMGIGLTQQATRNCLLSGQ